jgi:hypothetical protein
MEVFVVIIHQFLNADVCQAMMDHDVRKQFIISTVQADFYGCPHYHSVKT